MNMFKEVIQRLHHIGMVVKDLDTAFTHYARLGYASDRRVYTDDFQKVSIGLVTLGETMVELLVPLDATSPVARLWDSGGGFHHLCYEVLQFDAFVAWLETQTDGFFVRRPAPSIFDGARVFFWGVKATREVIEFKEIL